MVRRLAASKCVSRFQNLSDGQRSFIEEMFPRRTRRKGRTFADARLMVEGIDYRYRAGIAGRASRVGSEADGWEMRPEWWDSASV